MEGIRKRKMRIHFVCSSELGSEKGREREGEKGRG